MSDSGLNRVLSIPPAALRTVAYDFDGVIHRYGRGIHDGTCYDVPMEGALLGLNTTMQTRPVAVMTARPLDMVRDWFNVHAPSFPTYVDHGLHREWWDEMGTILLTNRKIVAMHYVDDRAIRHYDWTETLEMIGDWDAEYARRYALLAQMAAMDAEPCD